MKTRTALIYLSILVVLAGYFYYFEVVRRKARTEEKEASLRLFQVEKSKITSLQLNRGKGKPITLEKEGQWQVIEPIDSPADEFAVNSLLTILESLKMEREVETEARDLETYGLNKPRLKLSFLADGIRHTLRIGNKAVVMPGAIIEDDVIVKPCTVVQTDQILKKGGVYQGNPAKRIKAG